MIKSATDQLICCTLITNWFKELTHGAFILLRAMILNTVSDELNEKCLLCFRLWHKWVCFVTAQQSTSALSVHL